MSLIARDLSVEIAGKSIVDDVSFEVRPGDKVGLVGRNGAGKTTLFRVLGGATAPRAGTVRRAGATGFLSQDPRADDTPPGTTGLRHVLSGRGLDAALERLEHATAALDDDASASAIAAFAEAQEHFEHLGGYAAEAEVHRIVAGLGLAADRLERPVEVLSGGERRRLELARILFAGSDLLLLDEPTNHLDADARDWVIRHLRAFAGALVVISHDLGLLDDAITRVMHLDREFEEAAGELIEYRGTYSRYLAARADDEARTMAVATRQAKEITRLRSRADSMRGQTAKRARVAKNLDARAERIAATRVEAPRAKRRLDVRLPEPPPVGRTVLAADGLWKSFGPLDVFEDVSFDVGRGERLLVLGLNGAGKSTLLKVLSSRVDADLGEVRVDARARLGFFAQEHEDITAGRDLLQHMHDGADLGDAQARAVLGMFGFSGDKVLQDAATLSGGEKTKLALARLVAGTRNLLLLDEPTNNLDPGSRAAIGSALAGWAGTMVLVSHDPEFVRELRPDRVLLMPEGVLDHYSDDMIDLVVLA
ncbi:MAG: ABC-F family ATP-binding cassette domain-containing protein [Acidimicrobiia bacterium]